MAVSIALSLGYFLKPGIGLDLGAIQEVEVSINEKTPLVQILYEMIPNNPVAAMSQGNMLQIIVFAIITGVGLSALGDKAKSLLKLFEELNELMMKMVGFVMLMAPIGVFGLIAKTFATVGYDGLLPLLKYVGTVYLGLIIHVGLVYSGMLKGFTGLSPRHFFSESFGLPCL